MIFKKLSFLYAAAFCLIFVSGAVAQQVAAAQPASIDAVPGQDGIYLFINNMPAGDVAGFHVYRADLPSLDEIAARMEQVGATASAADAADVQELMQAIARQAFGDKTLDEVMAHAADLEKKTDAESRRMLAQYEQALDTYTRLLEQAETGMDDDLAQRDELAKQAMLDTYHDMAGAGPDTVYIQLTKAPVTPLKTVRDVQNAGVINLDAMLAELGVESLEKLFAAQAADPVRFERPLSASPALNKILGRLFVDATATQDARYAYKIVLVNAGGSDLQTVGPVETSAVFAPPTAPRALTIVPDGNRVQLAWEQPEPLAGIIGWNVLRADTAARNFAQVSPIMNPVSGQSRWTDNNAPGGSDCSYQVVSVTRTGQTSMPSNAAGADVPPSTSSLPRPTGVSVEPGAASVVISWNAGAAQAAAGVNVYRGSSMAGDATLLNQTPLPVADARFEDKSPQPGVMYYYRLALVDAQGMESEKSMAKPARVQDTQPPAAPASLTAARDASGAIQLAWQAGADSDITGYNMFRKTGNSGFRKITVQQINPQALSYTDPEPLTSGTYFYAVSAMDKSMNESPLSEAVQLIIPDTMPPAAPAGMSAVTGNGTAVLSWPPVFGSDVSGYMLYRSKSETGPYEGIADISAGAPRVFEDEQAQAGETYYYQLATMDSSGNQSPPCAPVSITVRDTMPPAAPQALSVRATAAGVVITWQKPLESDIAGFIVLRCETETGAYQSIADMHSLESGAAQFTDTTAPAGRQFWYALQAVDTSGNTSPRSAPAGPARME